MRVGVEVLTEGLCDLGYNPYGGNVLSLFCRGSDTAEPHKLCILLCCVFVLDFLLCLCGSNSL